MSNSKMKSPKIESFWVLGKRLGVDSQNRYGHNSVHRILLDENSLHWQYFKKESSTVAEIAPDGFVAAPEEQSQI